MRLRSSLTFLSILLLAAVSTLADTKVVKMVHQDGFTVMGQSQPAVDEEQVLWLGGDRMRMDQQSGATIVRLDQERLYVIDHQRQSYFVVSLPVDLTALLPPGMGEQMLQMMQLEITVTPSSETKTVGEWKARRYDMVMKSAMLSSETVLWAAMDAPVNSQDYYKLYGEVVRLQPGMGAVGEKMGSIEGFVVAQEGSMTMAMMGETKVGTSETVKSIDEMDAPAGTYDPPEGYREEPFDFTKMMQGGS